jgi:hypothetical protein
MRGLAAGYWEWKKANLRLQCRTFATGIAKVPLFEIGKDTARLSLAQNWFGVLVVKSEISRL